MMKRNDTLTEELVDETITPENAEEKGYTYIDDVFNPYEGLRDILEFASEKGYKFGTPDDKIKPNIYFGLYKPSKK